MIDIMQSAIAATLASEEHLRELGVSKNVQTCSLVCAADFLHPILGPSYIDATKRNASTPLTAKERKDLSLRNASCDLLVEEAIGALREGVAASEVASALRDKQQFPAVVLLPTNQGLEQALSDEIVGALDAIVWQAVERVAEGLVFIFGPDSDATSFTLE